MRRQLVVLAIGGALATGVAACGSSPSANSSGSGGSSTTTRGVPSTTGGGSSTTGATATAALSAAVIAAVDMERLALSTYQNVVAAQGDIAPFSNVIESEKQHVSTLERLAQAHGISLPSTSPAGPAAPATKTAACQLGVQTEQDDIALYGRLLPEVQAFPDAVTVFTSLQSASRDSHLPAFQHCA